MDKATSIERQQYMLNAIDEICKTDFRFSSFEEVLEYFKKLINQIKQMNYSEFKSDKFKKFESELNSIVAERKVS